MPVRTGGGGGGVAAGRDSLEQAALAEFVNSGGSLRGLTGPQIDAIVNTFQGLGGGRMSFEPGQLFGDVATRGVPETGSGSGPIQF